MSGKAGKRLVPELRFPAFRSTVGWEEKRLCDVFDFHSTANNSRADLSPDGNTYYVHYGDIHKKHHTYINFSNEEITKISSSLYKKATYLENGDLIIADASEDTDGIAKAVEVRGLKKGERAIAGLHTILLRDQKGVYANGFKGLLGEAESFKKQIKRLAVGAKVYSVSKTVLKEVRLLSPGRAEQTKIANCLSSIDDLITVQVQKIEILKKHKKGLMRQLLPVESETAPRVRFSEFRGKSGWICTTLGAIAKVKSGGTPSRLEPTYWNGNIPWVTTSLIDENTIFSVDEFITNDGLKDSSAKLFPVGSGVGLKSEYAPSC